MANANAKVLGQVERDLVKRIQQEKARRRQAKLLAEYRKRGSGAIFDNPFAALKDFKVSK